MQETKFLIWKYRFCDDHIDIVRSFFFEKCTSVSTAYLECAAINTNVFLRLFKRCNLSIISSSNTFTLWGIPNAFASKLCEGFTESGEEQAKIKVSSRELLLRSLLQSRFIWFAIMFVLVWSAVILFSGQLISEEHATEVTDFALRRTLIFGTLIMSLALPQALIWLWALTGGALHQFIKYYKYTATRTKDVICFEYGLLVYRKVYIPVRRVAITEYSQTPLMNLFGCGKLRIFAIGYNAYFMKSDTILPFVTNKNIGQVINTLLPEFVIDIKGDKRCPYRHFIIHWTSLLPIIPFVLSFIYGKAWLIVTALLIICLVVDAILLRRNSRMKYTKDIIYVSRGGIYHRATLLRCDMIESVSSFASVLKKRVGYVNFSIRVFGKDGRPIVVRNIGTDMLKNFSLPEK